jgi:hypothetical protein
VSVSPASEAARGGGGQHNKNLIRSDRVQPPDFNLVTNANLRAQKAVEPNA